MSDNARKTPAVNALTNLVNTRSWDNIDLSGRALPCQVTAVSGQIVTVKFLLNAPPYALPEVKMPVATSVYDWIPVQVGDQGVAVPIDVYQGGVSGLGGGTADLSRRANLSSLRYVPIANSSWKPAGGDGGVRIIQGPSGVRLQDSKGKTILVVDGDGHVTVTGDLRVSGEVIANYGGEASVALSTHKHDHVQPGTGDTGSPVPGS